MSVTVRESLGGLETTQRRLIVAATSAGVVATIGIVRHADVGALPAFLTFAVALVVLAAIDLECRLLPNRIVYPTTLVTLALLVVAGATGDDWAMLGRAALAGSVAFTAMTTLALISPAGFGMGDAKLSFVIGLVLGWLGWSQLVAGFSIAFLANATVALALLATRRITRKDSLPLGPFLALGAIVVLIVG